MMKKEREKKVEETERGKDIYREEQSIFVVLLWVTLTNFIMEMGPTRPVIFFATLLRC